MLRWQPKSGDSTQHFWTPFIGFSVLVHLALLVLLLVVGRAKQFEFTVHQIIDVTTAQVVLKPVAGGAKGSAAKSAPTIKKNSPAHTSVVELPQPRNKKKNVVAKKKNPRKKTAVKKKPKEIKKDTPIKKQEPAKKEIEKIEKKEVPQPPVAQPVASPAPPQIAEVAQAPDGPVQISYADARLAHQYAQLHQELIKQWTPPPGISDDTFCTLRVMIEKTGAVDDVIIEQPSGVLVFDLAARAAVLAMAWPSFAWGSSVVITFKP